MTRTRDVLHQERRSWAQGTGDAFQHARRLRLIVDRIESRDEIILLAPVERRRVTHLKANIVQSFCGGLRSRSRDPFLREVITGEPAARESRGQQDQGAPAPASYVQHVRALAQSPVDAFNEGQDGIYEG